MATVSEQIIANTNYSQMSSAAKQSTKTSSSSTSINSQAFLRLLTEQLKYQDPMNPTDNSEMLAQEAQFATLEQMESLASSFSSFSNVYQANSLLGQCVRVEVDGQGKIGVVEGVSFDDSNGASVFIGDKYYPLSSITNVYKLTPSNNGDNKGETDNKTEEDKTDTSEQKVKKTASAAVDAASDLIDTFSGKAIKNIYEYAKQTVKNII